MSKATLKYKASGNGYMVNFSHQNEIFDTYSEAYKFTKTLLKAGKVNEVENQVFPEHSVK